MHLYTAYPLGLRGKLESIPASFGQETEYTLTVSQGWYQHFFKENSEFILILQCVYFPDFSSEYFNSGLF